ncbi:MAG TPA: hypothetical protein VET27_10830 [Mycobacterium sp.]|nr:hypothetical protein [Mycobacterium sp.]
MAQQIAVAVTAMVVAAGTLAPGASADPAAPQPNSPCSANLAGALTQATDSKTFLECGSAAGSYRWQPFTGPYPSSDRWLSYGPDLTLHGKGRRNPEILSGDWIAQPQDPLTTCSAEQSAVVSAGEVGPPQTSTGRSGQPLEFVVLPVVFSISLTGNCLWERRD